MEKQIYLDVALFPTPTASDYILLSSEEKLRAVIESRKCWDGKRDVNRCGVMRYRLKAIVVVTKKKDSHCTSSFNITHLWYNWAQIILHEKEACPYLIINEFLQNLLGARALLWMSQGLWCYQKVSSPRPVGGQECCSHFSSVPYPEGLRQWSLNLFRLQQISATKFSFK